MVEEYFNQPKPKMLVARNLELKEEEGDENWENELVEYSYNPLEVTEINIIRKFSLLASSLLKIDQKCKINNREAFRLTETFSNT